MIVAAFVLDLLLGDPRWLGHPVRLIGVLALHLESPARRLFRSDYAAGVATAVVVISITGLLTWVLLACAAQIHPLAHTASSVLLVYSSVAARDLARHSNAVYRDLAAGNLPGARRKVALMVGRDTDNLTEPQVTRAAVESVAESTVDGVTAPLFYAALAGPVGAVVYKAVNTLDSTFGYRNERYLKFGWTSAKLDDLANLIPARATACVMSLAARLVGLRMVDAFKTIRTDARSHPSPNAGYPEAAMAGALGVQLGGPNTYGGRPSARPLIGRNVVPLHRTHVTRANRLMFVTVVIWLGLCVAGRVAWEAAVERAGRW